jgi:hypothetical protein
MKTLAVIAAAVIGLTALTVIHAGPASADPSCRYTMVGSEVTEDVMNAFALDQGGNELCSWDAVNPVTGVPHEIIVTSPSCSFTRPDGSTEGENALRKSTNSRKPS